MGRNFLKSIEEYRGVICHI